VRRNRAGPPSVMSSRLSLLVDLASRLGREVGFDALLGAAGERLASALSSERATIWLIDADSRELVTRVAVLPEVPALRQPMGRGIAGYVALTGECVRIDEASKDPRFDPSADRVTGFTTRSMLVAPLREDEHAPVRGVVQVLNRCEGTFDEADERYLVALASQLARALALTTLRAEDAAVPGVTLRGPFNRIVGRSAELARVYEQIALAAQTDASVLLRGETGTGKGIFARAIHVNSARQAGPFITVDCTTLPAQLVESELFGHERGAFTGADRRVQGRVELAAQGTLFLDEIGDLPHDVQGKLLRFLQDRTFERVGGRTTLEADVRVLAATHRDLEAAVAAGTFREDLYYRLRVVEMVLPPLRARGAEEIDALAAHFAAIYARRYGRPVPNLDPAALAALHAHPWPGNVRELEHWVESAVVLSPGGTIRPEHFPRPRGAADSPRPAGADEVRVPRGVTLEVAARRYAEAVLDACDGNKTEAARQLGISRNRLARLLKSGE